MHTHLVLTQCFVLHYVPQDSEEVDEFKSFNAVFYKGRNVILHGLTAAHFNNKKGKIKQTLSTESPERYAVALNGQKKPILLRPSNLMTVEGVPPTFTFKHDRHTYGLEVPLKATLGVSSQTNEISIALLYSDHMGMDALRPIKKKFFDKEDELEDIIGMPFSHPTTCLDEFRPKPSQIAIAMHKHGDVAKCMQQAGLIQMTGQKVQQEDVEFTIAKIKFQRMFYHDPY